MKFKKTIFLLLFLNLLGVLPAQSFCQRENSHDISVHIAHGDLGSFLADSVKWIIEKEPGRWITTYKTKDRAIRKFYKKIDGKSIENDCFIQNCLEIVFIDDQKERTRIKMPMDPKSGRIYLIEFHLE